jgi:hypothetical protein
MRDIERRVITSKCMTFVVCSSSDTPRSVEQDQVLALNKITMGLNQCRSGRSDHLDRAQHPHLNTHRKRAAIHDRQPPRPARAHRYPVISAGQ